MSESLQQLAGLRDQAVAAINRASDASSLEAARVRYLGRKSQITAILRGKIGRAHV